MTELVKHDNKYKLELMNTNYTWHILHVLYYLSVSYLLKKAIIILF